jgi:hypothetical protein
VLVPLCWFPTPAATQQFVTDDAGIVDFRACQLEGWHGESASWVLPACQPIRHLEITAGVGFIPENGSRAVEYVLQAKHVPPEVEPGHVGVSSWRASASVPSPRSPVKASPVRSPMCR